MHSTFKFCFLEPFGIFFSLTVLTDLWMLDLQTVNVRLEDLVRDDSLSLLGCRMVWGFNGARF